MTRLASRPTAILLVAIALLLRLAPIDHGMPRTYVPDTHMVRNALGMLQDKDLVPEVNRYSSYPNLVPYLLLPVYGAEYALGRATGAWAGPGEFGQRAVADPRLTALPARALMALLGALTAWALLCAARQAELGAGAWSGAWLAATCLLNVQLSTHERPWVAMVCAGAFCLWGAVAHERSGRPASLLASGAAAGLALAAHPVGAAFLGLCGFSWAFAPGRWRGRRLGARLGRGVACVATFALVALFLGHPYYLVHGGVPQQAVVGGAAVADDFSIGGMPLRISSSLATVQHLAVKLVGYDPILVVLGLVGLPMLFTNRGTRAAGAFTIAVTLFCMGTLGDHVRYMLPGCLMLALAGGMAAERLFASMPGAILAGALMLVPFVQALRLDWVLARTDTRAVGEGRLARLPAGSLVAIDHYGPTPDLSLAALERVAEVRGELRSRERSRLEQLRAGLLPPDQLGLDAIAVEELFGPDLVTGEYGVHERARQLGGTPREVFETLGVTHLLLVERRPSGAARPLAGLLAGREPLWEITPSTGGRTPSEAWLPTEMDFAFTALWEVERPGPLMRLYALAPPPEDSK